MFENNGHLHSPWAGTDNPLESKGFQKYESSVNFGNLLEVFPI